MIIILGLIKNSRFICYFFLTKYKKNIYSVLTSVAKNIVTFFILYKYYIMDFIKDSFRELKHVVWPTKDETIKYFIIVLVTLILFGIYLTIANYLFTEWLFGLQNLFSK